MRESQEMMHLLSVAKRGKQESSARGEVALFVWERYGSFMIRELFSYDRSEDREDLRQIFWMAVVEAFDFVDERGNPIFHLAQRGWWAVGAHIRRFKAENMPLSLDRLQSDDEQHAPLGLAGSDRSQDVEGLVVRQVGSHQQIQVLAQAEMAPIARRAFVAILSGKAGDPAEMGFNKRLAKVLKVSPQRTSQAMQALRKTAEETGIEA